MGLLRTLLIIVIVYYAFRFLARLFAPVLVKRMASKMQERAQQQYNQQRQNSTSAREGETVIDRRPRGQKQSNDDVGEYVDFEEID